jgi:hypothetical protein
MMSMNKSRSLMAVIAAVVVALSIAPASAQFIAPPGGGALIVPAPSSPPPPLAVVPVVPKLGDLPRQQNAPQPRNSFGDRITNCLQDGAAAGLGPNDRATYSRSCANR